MQQKTYKIVVLLFWFFEYVIKKVYVLPQIFQLLLGQFLNSSPRGLGCGLAALSRLLMGLLRNDASELKINENNLNQLACNSKSYFLPLNQEIFCAYNVYLRLNNNEIKYTLKAILWKLSSIFFAFNII